MSIRNEVFQEIAEEIWLKFELEIFFKLKETGSVHANRCNTVIREMEKAGVPKVFADRFIQNQLYDMRIQITEDILKATTAPAFG